MSDRHNGQLDEWLDSNHYDGCQRECSQRLLERESLGEDKKKKKDEPCINIQHGTDFCRSCKVSLVVIRPSC